MLHNFGGLPRLPGRRWQGKRFATDLQRLTERYLKMDLWPYLIIRIIPRVKYQLDFMFRCVRHTRKLLHQGARRSLQARRRRRYLTLSYMYNSFAHHIYVPGCMEGNQRQRSHFEAAGGHLIKIISPINTDSIVKSEQHLIYCVIYIYINRLTYRLLTKTLYFHNSLACQYSCR